MTAARLCSTQACAPACLIPKVGSCRPPWETPSPTPPTTDQQTTLNRLQDIRDQQADLAAILLQQQIDQQLMSIAGPRHY